MAQRREKWVDEIKVIACILVTLGHFFQSMMASGLLNETMLYIWFDRTIYYFHVPVFFMCSGYLYQKKNEMHSRFIELIGKGISLGVPYVFFSTASWLIKEVFSGSVNYQNAGFLYTLCARPASPYWYLYTLFFIFLIVPRFIGIRSAVVGSLCVILLKGLRVFGLVETSLYAVNSVMDNGIWFVFGMVLCLLPENIFRSSTRQQAAAGVSAGVFLLVSMWIVVEDLRGCLIAPVMGIWGCATMFVIFRCKHTDTSKCYAMELMTKYTMPIYLMHTIFAAGIRVVLLKSGIEVPVIHVILGVTSSFIGPIAAAWIMERLHLDFVLYPSKYIKKEKTKEFWNG